MEENIMRLLMNYDGSMTKALESLFNSSLSVNLISETIENDVIVRKVVLQIKSPLAFAVSRWNRVKYDEIMGNNRFQPIGRVLVENRIEQHREIVHIAESFVDSEVYDHLGIDQLPLKWRRYKVFVGGQELCEIEEYFSHRLYEYLVAG